MFTRHSWTRALAALAVITLAPLAMSACAKDKEKAEDQQATTQETEAKAKAEAPQALAPGADTPLDAVMPYYEIIRGALAKDDAAGAAAGAAKLRDAAAKAKDSAPEAMKAHLEAMATHAGAMADMKPENMEEMRTTFGEVSRPAVAMMQSMPDAAKNYHMFECTMAKGYTFWVQNDPKISNPYMGTSMPECGAKVGMMHGK